MTTINPARMQVSREIGGIVLEQHLDIEVDVHHPEVSVHVEIRAKDCYVYTEVLWREAPGRYQWAGYAAQYNLQIIINLLQGEALPFCSYSSIKRLNSLILLWSLSSCSQNQIIYFFARMKALTIAPSMCCLSLDERSASNAIPSSLEKS